MFSDTHAHLNFSEYNDDNYQIIQDCFQKGISIINVGVNFFSSQRAIEIAQRYENKIYAAIGLHPENIQYELDAPKTRGNNPEDIVEIFFDPIKYEALARSPKVVAVGEIGLDYLRLPQSLAKSAAAKTRQREIFLAQLDFARSKKLPVIIHCRLAHNEMIALLRRNFSSKGRIPGVIHCFSGGKQDAEIYYDLGFYFGINGIIFKADHNTIAAIAQIPLDRIVLETDCPFLAPPGMPRRNVPQNLPLIAQYLAQIRNDSLDAVIETAAANTQRLFNISNQAF